MLTEIRPNSSSSKRRINACCSFVLAVSVIVSILCFDYSIFYLTISLGTSRFGHRVTLF
ncbi:TPA: hypothetical protein ACGO14_001926 [Streptococcus suis]